MQTKTEDMYKTEIIDKLESAKRQIREVTTKIESGYGWKNIHGQIRIAILELKRGTKLLAKHHLKACIVEKHRKLHLPIVGKDIEEIVKTYTYINSLYVA